MAGKRRASKSTGLKSTAAKSIFEAASRVEHPSRIRMASLVTTNHAEIRNWAEQREGVPSTVRGSTTTLRIHFPDGPESRFDPISWDQWFAAFDENRLVFLYQEKTAAGKLSRFNKLVKRETIEGSGMPAETHTKTRTAGGRQAA